MTLRRRRLAAWLSLPLLAALVTVAPRALAGQPERACTGRTLILSAMPVELQPLLAATAVTGTLQAGSTELHLGRLRGQPVALALTGIGPVNAATVSARALDALACGHRPGVTRVLFSGVAGGDAIGDVIVPSSWTGDAGAHLSPVDSTLLRLARRVGPAVALEQTAPLGDASCTCVVDPHAVTTVTVTHVPTVEVGGTGETTDPFSGRALPCVPAGGDIFGCEPCPEQHAGPAQAAALASGALPFLDPTFFTGYSSSSSSGGGYVAEDEETAAVAATVDAAGIPFLGIRSVSDGAGDPLGLPGFPFQFFYYRQLAADNAAATLSAVLAALPAPPA